MSYSKKIQALAEAAAADPDNYYIPFDIPLTFDEYLDFLEACNEILRKRGIVLKNNKMEGGGEWLL
ncbi:MAG: hypothetical protein ACOYW7_04940 [Nitrospirota bacterium]